MVGSKQNDEVDTFVFNALLFSTFYLFQLFLGPLLSALPPTDQLCPLKNQAFEVCCQGALREK